MSRKMFFSSAASTDSDLMDAFDTAGHLALIWPWLLPYFDDWGRGSGEPRVIKASVFPQFPITEDDIAAALEAFIDADLLIAYTDERGRPVIAVDQEAWWRYQTHIRKDKREDDSKSSFPTPPPPGSAISREESRDSAQNRASLRHATPHYATLQPSPAREIAERPLPRVIHKVARELETTPDALYVIALDVTAGRQAEGYEVDDVRGFAISLIKKRDAEVVKRVRTSQPVAGNVTDLIRRTGKSIDKALA